MKSESVVATEEDFKTCKLSTLFPTEVTFQATLFTPIFFVFLFCGSFSLFSSLLRLLLTFTLLGMPEEPVGRPEEQLHHPHAPY